MEKAEALKAYEEHCHIAFSALDHQAFAKDFVLRAKKMENGVVTALEIAFGDVRFLGDVMHIWLAHHDESRYHDLLAAARQSGASEDEIAHTIVNMIANHPAVEEFCQTFEQTCIAA